MITVKAFKQKHGLNDSAFKRLVARAKSKHPGMEFRRRINSTDWEVLNSGLLEALLSPKQEKAAPEVTIVSGIEPLDISALQTFEMPNLTLENLIPQSEVATLSSLNDQSDYLVSGHSEVEGALLVARQAKQLLEYVYTLEREQLEIEETQVQELEDAAFDLGVHADCLRREGRRAHIERTYLNKRRGSAQKKVVNLRDFFDQRTASQ